MLTLAAVHVNAAVALPRQGPLTCPAGKTACQSIVNGGFSDPWLCVDTVKDNNNCGFCGGKCLPAASQCAGGKCICKNSGAPECMWSCPDYNNDAGNCGTCQKTVRLQTGAANAVPSG